MNVGVDCDGELHCGIASGHATNATTTVGWLQPDPVDLQLSQSARHVEIELKMLPAVGHERRPEMESRSSVVLGQLRARLRHRPTSAPNRTRRQARSCWKLDRPLRIDATREAASQADTENGTAKHRTPEASRRVTGEVPQGGDHLVQLRHARALQGVGQTDAWNVRACE